MSREACFKCGRWFKTSSGLRRHLKSKHYPSFSGPDKPS